MIRLESAWWKWDTSGCAQIDMVGVGDERLGRVHGGGGTRVVALELI